MKYKIARQFSLKNEKFEIISDSKPVCTIKASPSREYKGQFDVTTLTAVSRLRGKESCNIVLDSQNVRNYLIYIKTSQTVNEVLFGQLSYELCGYDNYLYTIIIGKRLYKVRSCDLKNRRLAIVDTLESTDHSKLHQCSTLQCPETLFQLIDPFSKLNETYHVTVSDNEPQLGYLALAILLDLHECQ